jgi:23S rRNA (adenine2030-N6)-methyltransferase
LARKLKTMSNTAGRPWVQVELNVGVKPSSEPTNPRATQLRASGMHIINPPFTLAAALRESLPVVMQALREPSGASWDVTHGG